MMLAGPSILYAQVPTSPSPPPTTAPSPPRQSGTDWLFLLAVVLALVGSYLFGKSRRRRRQRP
jgi:hypothetical protein